MILSNGVIMSICSLTLVLVLLTTNSIRVAAVVVVTVVANIVFLLLRLRGIHKVSARSVEV